MSGKVARRSCSAASMSSRSDLPLHWAHIPESIAVGIVGASWNGKSIAQSVGGERGEKVTSQLRQSGRWSAACAIQSLRAYSNAVAVLSCNTKAASHSCLSDRRMIVHVTRPPASVQKVRSPNGCGRLRVSAILATVLLFFGACPSSAAPWPGRRLRVSGMAHLAYQHSANRAQDVCCRWLASMCRVTYALTDATVILRDLPSCSGLGGPV